MSLRRLLEFIADALLWGLAATLIGTCGVILWCAL